ELHKKPVPVHSTLADAAHPSRPRRRNVVPTEVSGDRFSGNTPRTASIRNSKALAPTAKVTGNDADKRCHEGRAEGCCGREQQRNSGAIEHARQTIASQFIGPQQMLMRWYGIWGLSELDCVISGNDDAERNSAQNNGCEGPTRELLYTAQACCPRKISIARSDPVLAASVTTVTSTVTVTSRERSRPSAACQASWPIPDIPHSASTGIAAPRAMLTDTPANASICGPATGNTCQPNMRAEPRPLARAVMMCGRP